MEFEEHKNPYISVGSTRAGITHENLVDNYIDIEKELS